MKVPQAVFSCKKCKKNKHNFFKKRSNFQKKIMNKRKDFTPKKEMEKQKGKSKHRES